MTSIVYTMGMALIWVINLFNGTGLGEAYRTTEYAKGLVVILATTIFLMKYSRGYELRVTHRELLYFELFVAVCIVSSYIHGYGLLGFDYLWVYLLIFVIAQIRIDEKTIAFTGLIYGAFGVIILYIYNYGSALSGWNENTIAMIGMHSYLVFIIPFFKKRDWKSKIPLIVGTVAYVSMLILTDSRSGVLFAIIGALVVLSIIPRKLIDGGNGKIILFLCIPLIIAIFVANVSQMTIAQSLNSWSLKQFEKPIFNGRDVIWRDGFQRLWRHPLFGSGYLMTGYWHNCAIACLTSYGCVGFVLWLNCLYKILSKARMWLNDYIVEGCLISFLILYVQQSVELGLFGQNPNLIPYVMLGLMLGRIKLLYELKLEREEFYYV